MSTKKPTAKAAPAKKAPANKTSATQTAGTANPSNPPIPIEDGERKRIELKLIEVHPHNREINPETCRGLGESMKTLGQVQAAVVRPHPTKPGKYQLGAGARRLKGAALVGLDTLDCIIRNLSDAQIESMLAVENSQREAPEPRHEAQQVKNIVAAHPEATPDEIAAILGRTATWVKRRMKLLDLIPSVYEAWRDPESSLHHFSVATMELVASLETPKQEAFLEAFADAEYEFNHDKDVVHWIESIACSLKGVKWLENPATFIEGCGPGCASSSAAGDLFAATEFADRKSLQCANCLKPECFKKRRELAWAHAWETAIKKAPEGFYAITGYNSGTLTLSDGRKVKTHPSYNFHDWKAAKKGAEGAVAFLTENTDTGSVVTGWRVPPPSKKELGASLPAPSDAPSPVKSPEESQAASIDRVKAKRTEFVLKELQAHLDQAPNPYPGQHLKLITLAAIFGTNDRESFVSGGSAWTQLQALREQEPAKMEQALWDNVHGILSARIRDRSYTERKSDLLKEAFQAEIKAMAELTRFDLVAAEARAVLACPLPKALSHLNPVTFQPKAC